MNPSYVWVWILKPVRASFCVCCLCADPTRFGPDSQVGQVARQLHEQDGRELRVTTRMTRRTCSASVVHVHAAAWGHCTMTATNLAQEKQKTRDAREGTWMGKTRGKACKQAYGAKKDNKPDHRTAEATLRRQDTRVTTTVVTDLCQALVLAPRTDQVHPRPASSWLAAAHLAQSAFDPSSATGAPPADVQSAPEPVSKTVTFLEILHTKICA